MGLALGFLVLAAQPVVVGATLYYTTGSATASLDTLGSIGTDGSSQSTLASGSGNFTQPIGIAVDGLNSQIYVGDTVAPAILRYDLNGNNRTVILSSPAGNVNGLALDVANQKIYYTTGSGTASLDTLAVVNYNGSGQITLASGTGGAGSHSGTAFGNPQGIALDLVNQKIYVADGAAQGGGGTGSKIWRFDMDGANGTVVCTTPAAALGVALDVSHQTIYYVTGSGTSSLDTFGTASYNAGGGSGTTLASDAGNFAQPSAITLDLVNSFAYIADGNGGNQILRFNLAGSGRAQIGSTSAAALGIALPNAPAPVVSNVSASTANGSYRSGQLIAITVTFDQAVTVSGTPRLQLNSVGSVFANYSSGSGGTTLTFNYTVGAGDTSADLDYSSTSALTLNAGSIAGSGGSATLTLPSPGASGSLGASKNIVIDTTAPTLSIGAPSTSLTRGGPVDFTVTWTGASSITLLANQVTVNTTGSAQVNSISVSGSGNTRTVQLSQISGDGTVGISLPSGTATDTAGNSASGAGPSSTCTVDNTPPAVQSMVRQNPAGAATSAGSVTFRATFSEAISGLDAADFVVTGTASGSIGLPSLVSPGVYDVTVSSISGVGSLRLDTVSAASITDAAGNSISTTAFTTGEAYTIVGPVSQFAVDVSSASTTAGAALNVTVTAKDSFGSTVTAYTGTVHFTSTDGSATLPSDYTFTGADNGSHTFNNGVTFKTAGLRTLTAADTVSVSLTGTSTGVTVNPDVVTQLAISLPATAQISAVTATVQAKDAYGNINPAYTGTIHFTSSDGAATLPSDYTFTGADNGAHTFSAGVTFGTDGNQTVTVTDTVTASITGTSGTVAVDRNRVPVTTNDSFTRGVGVFKMAISVLLSNDHDPDSDPLSLSLFDTSTTGGGTVSRAGGFLIFTPLSGNTSDTFTYTVSDGRGGTAVATVTVTLTGADTGQTKNILGVTTDGADKVVGFAGIPGTDYTVQYTTSLSGTPVWTDLVVRTAGADGLFSYRDVAPAGPARFYRAIVP